VRSRRFDLSTYRLTPPEQPVIFAEIKLTEVPSGTTVFDWTDPKEWTVRDAHIKGPDGKRIVDFQVSNLHLMNYSTPVQVTLPLTA
jgi:aminopeptidase-like protein